ncbi:MAG TPA: hypothetical protein VKZ76_08330 [Edaphocola sp.]|nr:hypothetical protein [Edaphocola sp.]
MKYVPQAAPFLMVDTLLHTDEQQTSCSLTIQADNILLTTDGYFSEAGLIESMAQTAAAGTGYKAATQNTAPPVGFIGQVKQCRIMQLPKVGDTIVCTTTTTQQVMNASIVSATVSLKDAIIAQAEFKIFLQE